MWEVLYRCFPKVRHVGMKVAKINDPSNGMILIDSIHRPFGKFRCALVATVRISSDLLLSWSVECTNDLKRLSKQSMYTPSRPINASRLPAVQFCPTIRRFECSARMEKTISVSGTCSPGHSPQTGRNLERFRNGRMHREKAR